MAVRRWRRRSRVLQRLPAQGLANVAAQGPWRLPTQGPAEATGVREPQRLAEAEGVGARGV